MSNGELVQKIPLHKAKIEPDVQIPPIQAPTNGYEQFSMVNKSSNSKNNKHLEMNYNISLPVISAIQNNKSTERPCTLAVKQMGSTLLTKFDDVSNSDDDSFPPGPIPTNADLSALPDSFSNSNSSFTSAMDSFSYSLDMFTPSRGRKRSRPPFEEDQGEKRLKFLERNRLDSNSFI